MDLLYRKHEGVTLLCQNNEERSVRIFGMNEVMQQLLGYLEEEVKGQPLQSILSDKHAAMIDDYVDYEEDTNDLAQVMGKMRDLRLLKSDGKETPVEGFKIVRIEAKDKHQWFRLIVEDTLHKREMEAFKKILHENFKGHEVLDDETGLPDSASILKDLELSQYYVGTKGLQACYAYVRVDGYEALAKRYGHETGIGILKHVAASLRRNLRWDDTIGRMAEDALGMILMDIELESARVVINRLRWLVGTEEVSIGPMKRRNITVSIAFAPIGTGGATELPEHCQKALVEQGDSAQLAVMT